MHRPVLLVGGAPEVQIDAVRYMSVHASGTTALRIHRALTDEHHLQGVELLLSQQAAQRHQLNCQTYISRLDLEARLRDYLRQQPDAVILMSAAVNDYEFSSLSMRRGQEIEQITQHNAKVSSGADELRIHLKPAAKLIDQLKDLGHQGPLFACKYEASTTVINSAQRLCLRVCANTVLANSICGTVQALVDADGVTQFADRASVIDALTQRIMCAAQI